MSLNRDLKVHFVYFVCWLVCELWFDLQLWKAFILQKKPLKNGSCWRSGQCRKSRSDGRVSVVAALIPGWKLAPSESRVNSFMSFPFFRGGQMNTIVYDFPKCGQCVSLFICCVLFFGSGVLTSSVLLCWWFLVGHGLLCYLGCNSNRYQMVLFFAWKNVFDYIILRGVCICAQLLGWVQWTHYLY